MPRRNTILEALVYVSQRLLASGNLDETIPDVLACLGLATAASRVYIFKNQTAADGSLLANCHCKWSAHDEELPLDASALRSVAYRAAGLERWVETLGAGHPLYGLICDLPADEQIVLEAQAVLSLAILPIFDRNLWWGFLRFDDCERERTWLPEEIELLQSIASALGAAMENARLYEVARRQLSLAQTLQAVGALLTARMSLDEVFEQIFDLLAQVVDYDSVSIQLINGNRTYMAAGRGFPDIELAKHVVSTVTSPTLAERWGHDHQKVIVIPDTYADERWIRNMGNEYIRSWIGAGLRLKGRLLGILNVDSATVNAYDAATGATVLAFANQAAVAVENARLFEESQRQTKELVGLYGIAVATSGVLEIEVLLQRLYDQVQALLQPDTFLVVLYDAEALELDIALAMELGQPVPEAQKDTRVPLSQGGLTAWVVQNQKPLLVHDILSDPLPVPPRHGTRSARSWLGVPLVARDRVIGVVSVQSFHPHAFTDANRRFLESAANHVAVVIENARLFAAERRQLRLSQTMQQVGALLTTSLTLGEVFAHIFHLLAQVVAYDSVSVQLLDEEGKLQLAAGQGFPDLEKLRAFIARTGADLLDKYSLEQQVIIVPNTQADDRWLNAAGLEYVRSWVGAALWVKDRLIGILNVDSATPGAYNDTIRETVATFANQAAIAIENARLYEETRRRANELAVLHQVVLATAGVTSLDDLLRQTTETIAATLYPDIFGFVLVDRATGKLVPHPSYHGLPAEARQTVIPSESVTGYVARSGEPRIIPDVSQEPLYFGLLQASRSEIAVPLKVGHHVIGVINVESPRIQAFSETDARFLTTLAGQVAIAIERTQLYESLQQYAAHLALQVSRRTAELREERDRTQAILDSAGEGIFFTNPQGIILYANAATTRLTGYAAGELQGQNLRLWQSEQTPLEVYEQMWQSIATGQSWSGELVNRRKDGTTYDVNLTIAPTYRLADGELSGFVGIQSDISRLKEVDRLKSKFVSNVSHELRTPLTSIRTYATLLERGKPEKQEHYRKVLLHETERLTHLIQNLLDLSRLDTHAVPFILQPTDVSALATTIILSFAAKAESKHISLQANLPDGLPACTADPQQLEQVLTNLIGNALAYTADGGLITVGAGESRLNAQLMIWLRVSDTGAGIAPEELPRLFDRFFRGQSALDSGVPGTGLGLAICKEIIDRHQGKIEVESQLGQGTTFTVWLVKAG